MIGLLIFTAAMLAGCIFLLYFLVAIWRDAHKQRRGPRVEIIKLPSRRGFTNNKSTNLRMVAAFLVLTTVFAAPALAQETIFNVPSGDILDKGKVYGEFDFAYLWDASAGSYTPRLVAGIGHRVDVGINVNGITSPGPSQTTPTPTIKWKAYDGGKNGWAFMLGDDVFVPMQNRSYNVGNYIYGEFTKTIKTQTRVTLGAFQRGCQRKQGRRPVRNRATRRQTRNAGRRLVYRTSWRWILHPWCCHQTQFKGYGLHRVRNREFRRFPRQPLASARTRLEFQLSFHPAMHTKNHGFEVALIAAQNRTWEDFFTSSRARGN